MIDVVTVDIGHTMGVFTGPSTHDVLTALSPLARVAPWVVHETIRSLLQRTPILDEDLIQEVCARLLIDRANWPQAWPGLGFKPFPHAASALRELRKIAPVVALSNMEAIGYRTRMDDVKASLGAYLEDIYTSCDFRARKPEHWMWEHVAATHGTTTSKIVHVGDLLDSDVYGATHAGARVVHVTDDPTKHAYPRDLMHRVATAADLRAAAKVVRAWAS